MALDITEIRGNSVLLKNAVWTEEAARNYVQYSSEEEFQQFLRGEAELPSNFEGEEDVFYSVNLE